MKKYNPYKEARQDIYMSLVVLQSMLDAFDACAACTTDEERSTARRIIWDEMQLCLDKINNGE